MSKKKIWLYVALSCILLGGALFTGVLAAVDWDLGGLSTMQFEERTYEVTSNFTDIQIETVTADVWLYHTQENKITVICDANEKIVPEVNVIDGVLTISVKDLRAWYDHIGICFTVPKIKIYLPEEEYGKLQIKGTTGDTVISGGFTFESIDISSSTGDVFCWADSRRYIDIRVTTGDIRLEGKTAQSVSLKATTGDISLREIVVAGDLSVTGTTGDVYMEACDAESIYIKMTTGDVECSFLTPKAVSAHTTTGSVDVPDSDSGGSCEIKTTTGDIEVVIKQ